MVTQGGEESDEDHRIVCTDGTGAWAQGGRDQRVGGAFNNEERQIVMVLIEIIIEGELLLAIGRISGVIEIEHDSRWWLGVAGEKVIHKGGGETVEVFTV
jgi:hypothetical protein